MGGVIMAISESDNAFLEQLDNRRGKTRESRLKQKLIVNTLIGTVIANILLFVFLFGLFQKVHYLEIFILR